MDEELPSRAQVRAARALLDWSQEQLSSTSGTSRRTVAAFETGTTVSTESVRAMATALEAGGVTFIGSDTTEGVQRTKNER